MVLPNMLAIISILPSNSFSEKSGDQKQKVVVIKDDHSKIQGGLVALEYAQRNLRIVPQKHDASNHFVDIPFEKIDAICFVHTSADGQKPLSISKSLWAEIQAQNRSGTMKLTQNDGQHSAIFTESKDDLGGIFLVSSGDSSWSKIFFPFPLKKNSHSGPQLGQTMLKEGFISQNDLDHALSRQSEFRNKKIGEVLIEDNATSYEVVKNGIEKQKVKMESKLGEILVAAGTVSQSQLNEALQRQKRDAAKRLGQIFLEMGVVNEEMLSLAIALKFGLSYVALNDHPIDKEALACIPQELARKLKVFPLKLKGHQLTIALSDPTALEVKQDLSFYTEKQIKEVIASEQSIIQAIEDFYDPQSGAYLEKLLNKEETTSQTSERLQKFLAEEPDPEKTSEPRTHEFELSETTGTEKPIVELVNHILKTAVLKKASDLHILPERQKVKVYLRIDGDLLEEMTLSTDRLTSLVARLKIMGGMNIAERRLPQDGRAKVKVDQKIVDLRFSCLPTVFGESIVIRILDKESGVSSLDKLGFFDRELQQLRNSLNKLFGMFLVTGPTGSGKSSTIYACLQEPQLFNKNVITLEDPVEYELSGFTQIQIKESIGLSFSKVLRQTLRHDPDVIFVGEIRDLDTARIAVQSSLTGHLMISTLHTNSASEAFIRLNEMGIEPYLISSSIIGIVAQRLLKKVCPACKQPDKEALDKIHACRYPVQPNEQANFSYGAGCEKCNNTGYLGRTVVYEYLIPDERIKRGILTNKNDLEIRKIAQERGMRTIEEVALRKAEIGETSVDQIIQMITIS
jgi:type IV pilus assembly protein PilB